MSKFKPSPSVGLVLEASVGNKRPRMGPMRIISESPAAQLRFSKNTGVGISKHVGYFQLPF